jgi:hypothetical protein
MSSELGWGPLGEWVFLSFPRESFAGWSIDAFSAWIPDTDTGWSDPLRLEYGARYLLVSMGSQFEFEFEREGLRGRKILFTIPGRFQGFLSDFQAALFPLEAFSIVVFGAESIRGYEL